MDATIPNSTTKQNSEGESLTPGGSPAKPLTQASPPHPTGVRPSREAAAAMPCRCPVEHGQREAGGGGLLRGPGKFRLEEVPRVTSRSSSVSRGSRDSLTDGIPGLPWSRLYIWGTGGILGREKKQVSDTGQEEVCWEEVGLPWAVGGALPAAACGTQPRGPWKGSQGGAGCQRVGRPRRKGPKPERAPSAALAEKPSKYLQTNVYDNRWTHQLDLPDTAHFSRPSRHRTKGGSSGGSGKRGT